jgi:hypothetical protein
MTLEDELEDFAERSEEDELVRAVEIAHDPRLRAMALSFVKAVRALAESCASGESDALFRARIGAHLLVEEAVRALEPDLEG